MKLYDLVVIGGGFAGVAAAMSAAREGASVLIADKANCFGGAAVHCLVNPFMPNKTEINGKHTELSCGIFQEITEKLKERGAMQGASFSEEELKRILNEMLKDSGADILFHATLSSVQTEDGYIKAVFFATKGANLKIEGKYFIDATGDAQLAFLAGCPTSLGRKEDHLCQPMTLCFRVGNVDTKAFFASLGRANALWAQRLKNGQVKNPRENILVFQTPVHNVLHFNTTRIVKKNPVNPLEITTAEIEAREQVYEVYDFLKENADGMQNSVLLSTAAEIGVRESRKIEGEYVLTEADCRSFQKFEDGIAACNYDIDIHNPEGTGTSHYYFPKGAYYTIPYRSLIPKGVKNMLAAGRCISSDHGAQASYRIMPVVCCIGQAAGSAISIALKNKQEVRKVNCEDLRNLLLQNGAFLGNLN